MWIVYPVKGFKNKFNKIDVTKFRGFSACIIKLQNLEQTDDGLTETNGGLQKSTLNESIKRKVAISIVWS